MTNANWIALCVVTAPHGVSGRVKLKPYTEVIDGVTAYGELCAEDGTPYPLRVTGEAKGQLIVEMDAVKNREAAEKIRGLTLGVPADRLPALEENDFYINDLVGLNIITEEGEAYGSVKSVDNFGAGDLIEVTPLKGKATYYAFTHANFPKVDVAGGTLTFTPPELIIANEEGREEQA